VLDRLFRRPDVAFLEELTFQLDPTPDSFDTIQRLAKAGHFRSLRRIELIFVPPRIVSTFQELPFANLSELKLRVYPSVIHDTGTERISGNDARESPRGLDPGFEDTREVVGRLVALDWSGNSYPDAAVGHIVSCPFLQSVAVLDIGGNRCGQHTLIALAHAPYRRMLQKVSLRESPIGATGWDVFANNMFPHLANLDLAMTDCDGGQHCEADEAIQHLANSGTLPLLQSLAIDATHIGPNGTRAFAVGRMASRLIRLSIHDLTSDASNELFHDPAAFPHLVDLELINCTLRGEAIGRLRRVGFLSRLRRLVFLGTRLSANDAEALFGSIAFDNLHELDISFQMAEETALTLFRVLKADQLRVLRMQNNGLTVGGMAAFARWDGSRQLWIADLALNRYGDEGVDVLRRSEGSWRLNQLITTGSRCSHGVERCLVDTKQFPWLKWINGFAVGSSHIPSSR
jgi:hypothetical protein